MPPTPLPTGFTAHNVRLDDGTLTYPAAGATMDQLGNYRCVRNMLQVVYPDGYAGKSIVDLGCLEGGFTAEFARLGLQSTGIEIREENLKNARFVKERLNLANLTYHRDDAWNVGAYGPFDVVFCVGLYYHIEDARRFLQVLSDACNKLLFLDTHLAPEDDDHPSIALHRLSPLTEHEGMLGRWYPEHDLDVGAAEDVAQLETLKWASWANRRSFWPTKGSLIDAMHAAGFEVVLEGYDTLGRGAAYAFSLEGWHYRSHRWMMIGVKLDGAEPATSPPPPPPPGALLANALAQRARAPAPSARTAALEADNAALRAALARMANSTSWKLTGPVRALKRMLGG